MCTHTYCLLSHTHSGILLSIVKNEILPFAVLWVDLKSISEGSHRVKCCILSLICGIFKKKKVNRYNKTETDLVIENKLVDTSGERSREGKI